MRTKTQHTRISGTQPKQCLEGKYIAISAHIRRIERSEIDPIVKIERARGARSKKLKT